MEISFLLKSYSIGFLAALGLGPIFILTFNRSAICGFWKGMMTAIGASLADALYFLLGLLGALAVLEELRYFMVFLNLIGGLVLFSLGIHTLKKMRRIVLVTVECSYSSVLSMFKAFMITILNPLVILFFMVITAQVLPEGGVDLPRGLVILSGFCAGCGSLTVLGAVALVASCIGSCITAKWLRTISAVTGVAFILFGGYLLSGFVVKAANLLKTSFFF